MVLDALRERSMDGSVRGAYDKKMVPRRQRKRGKVTVGPGSKDYKAGHETYKYGELRVKWRGLCALKGGAEHECVRVGVTKRS